MRRAERGGIARPDAPGPGAPGLGAPLCDSPKRRGALPPDYVPRNGCSECGCDFTSLAAFDRHRYGTNEPLARRCLTHEEMAEVGLRPLTAAELAESKYRGRAGIAELALGLGVVDASAENVAAARDRLARPWSMPQTAAPMSDG